MRAVCVAQKSRWCVYKQSKLPRYGLDSARLGLACEQTPSTRPSMIRDGDEELVFLSWKRSLMMLYQQHGAEGGGLDASSYIQAFGDGRVPVLRILYCVRYVTSLHMASRERLTKLRSGAIPCDRLLFGPCRLDQSLMSTYSRYCVVRVGPRRKGAITAHT